MKAKLSTVSISILLVGLLVYGFISLNSNDPYTDYAPGVETSITTSNGIEADTITPSGWPFPVVWNFYYGNIANINGGNVGACFYSGNYFFNRWNSTTCYFLTPTGTNGGPGGTPTAHTYTGSIRDMTVSPATSPRGYYIWGGKASSTLYKLGANAQTLNSYSVSGASFRAIAYDPVRDAFWNSNFGGNITCKDTTGATLVTYTNTWTAKYGMAYDDKSDPDSVFLWVWTQLPGQTIHKLNITTGTTPILAGNWTFTGGASAGGAEAYESPDGTEFWLVLCHQNFANVAYKIAESGPPPSTFHYNALTGSGNTFPLGQSGGKFVNWLFPPGAFALPTPCPANNQIDTVHVRMYGTGSRTYTTLIILMAQTTLTNLTSGSFYAGPWDTVYSNASVSLTSGGANTWLPIALDNPYPYDPTKALVVGIGQCHGTGSGMYVLQTTLSGTKRTWSVGGCPFVPYSSGDARDLCMGISVTPLSGITPVSNIPEKFSLSQNYPNPFNPTTTINFSVPKSGLVTLRVYDVLGKEVASLVNEVKNAGSYSVDFNGTELTSGTYFYRIEAGDFTDVKKMILLK